MAGIKFDITGDNTNFLRAVREAEEGVRNASRQIEENSGNIEKTFERIKQAAEYAFIGFSAKEFISSVAQVRGEFQQLEVAFSTMLGSKEKADALMQQLVQTAAITPFDLQGVANGAKQLLAYGDSVENVNDDLIRLGNIAAGLSQPLGDIVYLYGTTMTQGRLYTQDLNQFTGRGIPMIRELANLFGVAENEVKDLVTAGKVGFPEVQKVIQNLTNEGGMFYNLMQEQSKTITGQISNIADAFDTMLNNIGKANEGVINDALSGVSYLVENYEQVGKILTSIVVTYGAYKAAVITVTAIQSAHTIGLTALSAAEQVHYGWLVVTTTAQKALNAAMLTNPYVAVAAVVAALGTAMWALADHTTTAEKTQENYNKTLEKITNRENERKQKLEELVNIINSEVEADVSKTKALKKLEQEYPMIFQKFVDEKGHITDLIALWKVYNDEALKENREAKQAEVEKLDRRIAGAEWAYNLAKQSNDRSSMKEQSSLIDRLKKERAKLAKDVLEGINEELEVDENREVKKQTTYQEDLAKAKDDWEKAKKGYESLVNDQESTTEQVEAARKQMESAEKAYKELGGNTKANTLKVDDKQLEQQQRIYEQLLSLRRQNQQDEINLMKDGEEKKLKQIDLDYQKELDTIKKQRTDWEKEQSGQLSQEQTEELTIMARNAYLKRESGIDDVRKSEEEEAKAREETQRKAWQEYFIEYGNYQEKRKNLIQKYDDEIAQLQADSPEYAIKVAEKDDTIEKLDEQYGKSTRAMADLFEDASNKSVSSIQAIIDKYELLISYLSNSEDVELPDLKDAGFTDSDIKKIESGEISIKDVTDAVKDLKDELKGKSPWKTFVSSLTKGIDTLKNASGDTGEIGQGIIDIGNAVTSFAPALSEFGSNIANIFGFDDSKITGAIDALGGLGQTAAGVGQIMAGDIAGGAMSAVSGISSVVSALDGMFGADYSQYNKMKEEYDALIDVWDTLIEKKQEYIDIDYGIEAAKAAAEATKLVENNISRVRQLVVQLGKSGSSIGSHSLAYRVNDRMDKNAWSEVSKLVGQNVIDFSSLFSVDASKIGNALQSEKLVSVLTEVNSEFITYIQDMEKYADQLEEIARAEKEAFTGISFDSFRDSFVDTLADLDSTNKDFADNFEKYLQNAVFSSLVANQYKDRIQALYDRWAAYAESDDDLSKEEVEALRAEQERITEDMLKKREELMQTFGWASTDSYSQQALSKGIQSMSQDTGEELNGRFTAIQASNEEIKNQIIAAVSGIYSLVSTSTESNTILDNILTQHVLTNGYLEDIAKYSKVITGFGAKLDKIVEQTK